MAEQRRRIIQEQGAKPYTRDVPPAPTQTPQAPVLTRSAVQDAPRRMLPPGAAMTPNPRYQPAQMGTATSPPSALDRLAPKATAAMNTALDARPQSTAEGLGVATRATGAMLARLPEAVINQYRRNSEQTGNALRRFGAGLLGISAPPAVALTGAQAPAPAQPAPRPAPVTQPAVATPPAATATAAPAPAATPSTPAAPAPAPALTRPPIATNSAGQPLPGSPTRGANGEVVYDDAWAANNQGLIKRYADTNVVQSVVPAPGVAASTVTGGQMPSGALSRPPQGRTPEQIQMRLDNMDRQGRAYTERELREIAVRSATGAERAAQFGDAQGAASRSNVADMAGGAAAALAAPPRVEPLRRADPAEMARIAIDQQRTDIDASRAAADNQVAGLQAQGQQLQLQQARQMQQLSEQIISGTDEQRRAATASMAALQGTKPGQPIRVKRQFDTGQKDALGSPILGEEEVLFDPSTGRWLQPPAAAAQNQVPQAAIDMLRQNDTPQMREMFKQRFGVDAESVLR